MSNKLSQDNMPLPSLMNHNSSGQKPKRRRRKINLCGHNKNPRIRQRRRRHEKNIPHNKYKHVHNHKRPATKALGSDHKPRKKTPTNGRNNIANCSTPSQSTLPPPSQPTTNTSSTQINTSNECRNGCSKLCVRLTDDKFLPHPLAANTPSPPPPSPHQKKVQHAVLRTESRFILCIMKLQLQLLLLLPGFVCAYATNSMDGDKVKLVIVGLVVLTIAGVLMVKQSRGEANNDSDVADEEMGESTEGEDTARAAAAPPHPVQEQAADAPVHFVVPKPGDNGAVANVLDGKRFVITGTFPEVGGGAGSNQGKDRTKEMIESFGGKVTSAVSGKTDFLLVGTNPLRSKVSQADLKDVPSIDLFALRKLLMGQTAEVELKQSAQAAAQQPPPAQASSGLSLKFPPGHTDFTSDSTDSNSGVLFREKKGNETIFWVVDKGLIPEFMSCGQNKGVTLRFVPYSSKEGWWEKYPETPLMYDILPCPQEVNSKFRWKVVIPDKTLDNYLSREEKNCFPRATLLALQHFKMSVVTPDDIQAFTHHSQIGKYHEGYPCILCTCCSKKLFYDSAKKLQDMINGGIIKHLLECESFGADKKAKLTRLRVCLAAESKNADYLEGCSQYVSVRLGRLSMGNCIGYNHQAMIDRAKVVNDLAIKKGIKTKDNKNHVPVYEIYQEAEVKNLIYEILAAKLAEKDYTFEQTVALFKTVKGPDGEPIDITIFREDWEQRFNEEGAQRHTQFHLKLCFLYMMRYKQHGCPRCDTLPDDGDAMFGGDGESNHVEADGAPGESWEADTKSFDLSYRAANLEMSRLVAEIGESQKECKCCHNHFGSTKPYWEMDDKCYGKYDLLEGVRMYSDVQATPECQRVHDVVDKLIDSIDLNKVSYSDLVKLFKIQRYDFRDITLFREPEWRDANNKQRTIFVKQIEYCYEKRSIGGCFLCDHSILNSPARDFCSVDSHHVDPKGKDKNPSYCVNMGLKEGRLERRKCCPLCRPCHVKVHHVESKEAEFNKQLEDKEYEVKSSFEVAKK